MQNVSVLVLHFLFETFCFKFGETSKSMQAIDHDTLRWRGGKDKETKDMEEKENREGRREVKLREKEERGKREGGGRMREGGKGRER